ncbi:MAG: DUF4249 family protein [Bacteroidota bacterium]
MRKKLVAALLGLSVAGCLPESLLIEVTPAPSKVVVSSINIDTLGLAVLLTRSFSALEGNDDSLTQDFINQIVVAEAEVSLTIDDQSIDLTQIEEIDGIYFTDDLPVQDNQRLRLDIFDPASNSAVFAETTAMPPISLDTAVFFEEIVDEDTIQRLYYEFTDPSGTDNWYSLNVFDPFTLADEVGENIFSLNGGNSGAIYERLISDQEFEGAIFSDTVRLSRTSESDTIAFFFSNISEGYFRFLDVRQRFGGILSDSEPVNFPSNVIGGLGYFTFNNPRIRVVRKEKSAED